MRTLTASSLTAKALLAGALMRALPVSLVHAVLGVIVRACAVQNEGLLVERWFFVSQARHPRNLCYPVVS